MKTLAAKRAMLLTEADDRLIYCKCGHSERLHKTYYGDECIVPYCKCDGFTPKLKRLARAKSARK